MSGGSPSGGARARYLELIGKVEAFFDRVQARYPEQMRCGAGCSTCCHARFSVAAIEADAIADGVRTLPAAHRARLQGRARTGDPGRCAALADDGRCEIYRWRPLVCRSHGVPVRQRDPDRPGALPVVEVCELNFTGGTLDRVAADCVLDQATLSTVVAALDAAHAVERGTIPGRRVDLAELLAELE